MKQFKKLLALLLVLCVAGLPVFALATDETGDGQSTETVSDPPQEPAPEPPKEQPKEPEPEPVQPPTTNENPDPPVTNPENPPTTETTTETTTDAPTTDTTTEAPTTDTPTTDAPTTDTPTTSAPATDAPTTSAPTTETSPSTETMEVPVDELLGNGLEMDEALMQMLLDPPLLTSLDDEHLNIDEGAGTCKVELLETETSATVAADAIIAAIEGKSVKKIIINANVTITGSDSDVFSVEVDNSGTIQGGKYTGIVTTSGTISGGTYTGTVKNTGTINNGNFGEGSVVENSGTIQGTAYFEDSVQNVDGKAKITSGTFTETSSVENNGTISSGSFAGLVENKNKIEGGSFTSNSTVTNSGTISGDNSKPTFNGSVNNNAPGEISGGAYTGTVENGSKAKISGGKFSSRVNNYGEISKDALFSNGARVYNGAPKATPTPKPTNGQPELDPTIEPSPGTISGGTFNEGSELHNNHTVTGATIEGVIFPNYGSTAEDCDFKETAKTNESPTAPEISGGKILVNYYINGKLQNESVDYKVKAKSVGLPLPQDKKEWRYYDHIGGNSNSKKAIDDNTKIDIYGRDFCEVTTPDQPSAGQTNNNNNNNNKNTGNGSNSGSSYSWTDPATSDWSDPEGEEEIVLGPEQSLADDFLKDGDSVKLDIMHNGSGVGTDYELIPIPATSPEPTATDGTAAVDDGSELDLGALDAASDATAEPEATEEPEDTDGDGIPDEEDEDIDGDGILNEEDEDADGNGVPDAEEEIARIPGEADEEGNVPGMLYVRAKGLGTEERKLSLTFSQLERMHREQGVDVLLFRNGSATVSMNVSPLFEGNIAKLMELMHAWEYNGANFDDYDLSIIDFDAIQIAPVFTDEELREFKLEMSIAPAVPVGYTVQVKLCLGENSKEISLLLEEMGVTMHAQTVTDNVAVYYMNAEQERFLLETHEGVVPGVDTEIEGYEVLFDNGTATVLDLSRSVTDTEFAGLCASTGDTGTYYIGVLPSAQASAEPTDEEAEAEETPEPTEEPTPEPTEEPEDLSMELVVDVPR